MKLQAIIALIAIVSFAGAAQAQSAEVVASSAATSTAVVTPVVAAPAAPVAAAPAATVPAQVSATAESSVKAIETKTVVTETKTTEAGPIGPKADPKIDNIRRTRQEAEAQTSEKVEEKIEKDRLTEENRRADRLFGERLETPAPGTAAATLPAPAPAPVQAAPIVIVTPILNPAPKAEPIAPTPAPVKEEAAAPAKAEGVRTLAPVADEAEEAKPEASLRKFYVGAVLAAPEYSANNVKTNYGLGVSVGTFLDQHSAVELSFLYSDYYVDTFWRYGLYTEMTQYDVQGAYKYYILTGPIKPYVGASLSYIMRSYQDRVKSGLYYQYNSSADSAQTNAVDAGILAGVDFNVNENFMLGIGVDYNHNVMNSNNNFGSVYNLQPGDTKAIEEIDYYVVKLTAKILF